MLLSFLGFLNLSFTDALDILMVATIIFFAYRWIRGSSAMDIFMAIILLFIIKVVVTALDMKMMSGIMSTVIDVGVIALIVIFQPEIRHFLIKLGSKYGVGGSGWKIFERLIGKESGAMGDTAVSELVEAVKVMADQKTGALVVVTRQDPLQSIIDTGDVIDAKVSRRLLLNLFFKNSPLHDGAIIIKGDRIIAARCTLPLTGRANVPAHYGMRHKAAIGISEESDACVVVVSEETGVVSFISDGQINTLRNIDALKELLAAKPSES